MVKEILAKLSLSSKSFEESVRTLDADMATLGVTALGLSASIGLIVKASTEYQTEIVRSARASQESTKEMSKLNYVAEVTGIAVEDLSDDLEDLVKVFNKTDDPTKQAQAAFDAFGAEGLRLVPILQEGEDALEAFKNEAVAMGLVVSERAGAQAQQFEANIKKVSLSLKGLTVSITDSIVEFVNQSGVLESVKNAIVSVTTWWRNLSDSTKETIVKAILFVSTMGAVLSAVAAVVTVVTMLVGSLTIITAVITGAVAVLGALAFGIIDYWNEIKNSILPSLEYFRASVHQLRVDFRDFVDSLADDSMFKSIAKEFLNIGDSAEEAGEEISIMGTVANFVVKAIATGLVVVVDAFGAIKQLIQDSAKQWSILGQAIVSALDLDMEGLGYRLAELKASVGSTQDDMAKRFDEFKKRIDKIWEGDVLVRARESVKRDVEVIGTSLDETKDKVKGVQEQTAKFKDFKLDELRAAILGVSVAWEKTEDGSTAAIKSIQEQIDLMEDKLSSAGEVGGKPLTIQEELELEVKIKVLEDEKANAKIIAFTNLVEASAKKLQLLTKPFSDISEVIAEDIKRAADVEDRNMEVLINRKQEEYEKLVALTEKGEQAKIDAINSAFEAEINSLQKQENKKLAIVENAAASRLLALDQEFVAAKQAQEAAYQAYVESETQKFEFDKEILLQKAYDKEQRMLAESMLDADFKNFMKNQQAAHEQSMDNLVKQFAQKKKDTETKSKDDSVDTKALLKQKIEDLQKQQNLAVTTAEKAKDDKLEIMERQHNAEMAALDKQRVQKQWEAEVATLEATKAAKVTEILVSSAAAAAQAFVGIMGASLGLGAVPAGIVAGIIMTAGALRAAQVASQTVVKPAALMADGGVIGGNMPHSAGGVRAELESGEAVISKDRTSRLMGFIDNLSSSGGITVNIQPGAIVTGDSLLDARTIERFSYLVSQNIERYGAR